MRRPGLLCKSNFSVVGRDLDPEMVTRVLGIAPDRAFKRGEQSFAWNRDGTFDYSRPTPYKHSKGSWLKSINKSFWIQFVPEHLAHWSEFLRAHEGSFRQWLSEGSNIAISFYIDWAPTDFCVSAQIMKVLGDFDVDLRFGVWPPECFSEPLTDEEMKEFEEK